MRDMVEGLVGLDADTILQTVPENLREVCSQPRFLSRMSLRRGRKIAANDLFARPAEDREAALIKGGPLLIEEMTLTVGAHVLWPEIIRLVRRVDSEKLDNAIGISTRPVALRGRTQAIGVTFHDDGPEEVDLAERIRTEGALSWACWLTMREPGSARRLRVLTPHTVSYRVGGRLPADAEQRNRRRLVVDAEIEALMNAQLDEVDSRESA